MGAIASQLTSLSIVYSIVDSGADQRKYQSSASLAFVWGIHRWPVNSPHKKPVTRKMFPFDDVIMNIDVSITCWQSSGTTFVGRKSRKNISVHQVLIAFNLMTHWSGQLVRFEIGQFNQAIFYPLRWRHNDHAGVSNHQPRGCLLNRLFRHRSKKTSKLRVTGFCSGNSRGPVNSPHEGPVTRKMFPFDDVIMEFTSFRNYRVFKNDIFMYWDFMLSQTLHQYDWLNSSLSTSQDVLS